jgi:thiol:disulfide interchange protein DsbD
LIARFVQPLTTPFLLLFLLVLFPGQGRAQVMPLPPDQAFHLSISRQPNDAITFKWTIAPGYYLYRDRIKVTVGGADMPAPLVGHGMSKDDPSFGPTEIYHDEVATTVSRDAILAGAGKLLVTYQGCQEGGICYPPITRNVDPISLALTDESARPEAAAAGEWQAPPSAETTQASGITLAADENGGLVASLLKDGGVPFVLGSFLVFGIALAFTPCVFPMYPILAGAIARAGERVTPLRGFTLSGVYVLAMSSAFGLLGIAAAWSGQNLQMVLQSPLAVGAVAILFVALALSMFGLYELQFPSRWVTALGTVGQGNRGSLTSTAALGFTSALIVGPCVTAPLAGALLYIAQSGNVGLGAMSLFALGIGKGIPLMIFGTFGPQAMPKAGRWLVKVKELFGLVFLGLAISMLARFVPTTITSVLWGLLAIGTGVRLGAIDLIRNRTCMTCRVGPEMLGIGVAIYGLILVSASIGGQFGGVHIPTLSNDDGGDAAAKESFVAVANAADLSQRVASSAGKPSLVYVTADWCVTCAVINRTVLPDATVRDRLAGFNLVKIDVSGNTPEQQQMMKFLRVVGPPTMIFVDPKTKEVPASRLIGDITVDALLASADKAESIQ